MYPEPTIRKKPTHEYNNCFYLFVGSVRLVRFDSCRADGRPAVRLLQMLQVPLRVVDLVPVVLVTQMVHLVLVILDGRVRVERLVHLGRQLAERLPQCGNIRPQLGQSRAVGSCVNHILISSLQT